MAFENQSIYSEIDSSNSSIIDQESYLMEAPCSSTNHIDQSLITIDNNGTNQSTICSLISPTNEPIDLDSSIQSALSSHIDEQSIDIDSSIPSHRKTSRTKYATNRRTVNALTNQYSGESININTDTNQYQSPTSQRRQSNRFNQSISITDTNQLSLPINRQRTATNHHHRLYSFVLCAVLLCCLMLKADAAKSGPRKMYTNQWAVEIHDGLNSTANALAAKYGYVNLGLIMDDYYLFASPRIRKRSVRNARRSQMLLGREKEVDWLEQQVAKRRVKRGYRTPSKRQSGAGPSLRLDTGPPPDALFSTGYDKHRQKLLRYDTGDVEGSSAKQPNPNDAFWPYMWYLHRPGEGLDHNVKEAWDLGYTGKGIVVTILDDGLERTHPDIRDNYDALASHDVNDHDSDPTPRYDDRGENRHGTRCAGEVAAVYNNTLCIVGIAFNSRIGGIRMLDGDVTDAVEAASLSHNRDHIDIYSASWGPDDDGRTVDGPAHLARLAFQNGIVRGRKGLGSIFVWASGNGGRDADSCNCDGYTNSIHTLSISSATENGNVPWYSEACSSTMATTFSSGAQGEQMIITTDLRHSCTRMHSGTSASAPLAAAIAALTLEANPMLTWRDMQHVVVRTANPRGLGSNDWQLNGVGRNVSHSFGFGLMDAGAMVRLAKNWSAVPAQRQCRVMYPQPGQPVPPGGRVRVSMTTDGCEHDAEARVSFIEHVQAVVTVAALKRGDLQIFLTSPSGTRTTLLPRRARDVSRSGFTRWPFMTTHCWGERAAGEWTMDIENRGWEDASLISWSLELFGTAEPVGPYGGYGKKDSNDILAKFGLPSVSAAQAPLKATVWSVVLAAGMLALGH